MSKRWSVVTLVLALVAAPVVAQPQRDLAALSQTLEALTRSVGPAVVQVFATRQGTRKAKALMRPLEKLYDTQLGHLAARDLDTLNDLMVRVRKGPVQTDR